MAYMADIILSGDSSAEIDDLVQQLHTQFSLKDIGELNYFLGVEVHKTTSEEVCPKLTAFAVMPFEAG